MSALNSIDIATIFEALRVNLETWAPTLGGQAFVARDPWHAVELLAESPAGWRLIMQYERDTPSDAGAMVQASVTQARMLVYVSTNPGLHFKTDLALIKTTTRASLLKIVGDVRSRFLAYRFPATAIQNGRLYYEGCSPVTIPDALPLAAYRLDFSFRARILYPADADLVNLTP